MLTANKIKHFIVYHQDSNVMAHCGINMILRGLILYIENHTVEDFIFNDIYFGAICSLELCCYPVYNHWVIFTTVINIKMHKG